VPEFGFGPELDMTGPRAGSERASGPFTSEGLRRPLTLMFCDLVGSARITESLDPERVREVLIAYQEACATVVKRFEGHIARYMGDGVLVYFGHPLAHEDDPRRAALAGLEIVAAVEQLSVSVDESYGVRLAVRVGIHTGLVVIADMGGGEWRETDDIVGEIPSMASRIQSLAEPNSVLVSAATNDLLAGSVEVESLGEREVRGFSRPVELYRAIAATGRESGLDVRPWRTTRLVGRFREQEALAALWAQVTAGTGKAVVIEGEAGIGKSRLVEHFRDQVEAEGGDVVTLQCSPYRTNTVLSPVLRRIEQDAGFARGQPELRHWDDLARVLGGGAAVPDDEVAVLAHALAVPLPPGVEPVEVTIEQRRERTFAAVLAWLARRALVAPTLVVVEDVHWADPTTVELLGRVVASSSTRQMTMVTSRPENRPGLGTAVPTIRLSALGPEERRQMVDDLVVGENVDSDLAAVIVERSDGVPLFIEELTHVMLTAGTAGRSESGPELIEAFAIPPTVHDLLTARLQQFPAQLGLAQAVATVGGLCPRSLVEALVDCPPAEVGVGLGTLVTARILTKGPEDVDPTYRFRHILLRDAAYQSQLLSRRRQLHGQIAATLEERFPGVAYSEPEVLAHHYERAEEPLRAAQCWYQAATASTALAAHTEAVEHHRRSLAALAAGGSDDSTAHLELEVQVGLGANLVAARGYTSPEAEAAYSEALALSQRVEGGDVLLSARWGMWAYYDVRADHVPARTLADQCLEVAKTTGRRSDVLVSAMVGGYQHMVVGEFDPACPLLQQAASFGAADSPPSLPVDLTAASLSSLASVFWILGYPGQARQAAGEAIRRSDLLGSGVGPFTRAYVHTFLAWYHQMAGQPDLAADRAMQALAIATEYGFPIWLSTSAMHLAIARVGSSSSADSVPTLAGALLTWRQIGAESFRSYFLGGLAAAQRAIGDLDAARSAVDEGLAHATDHGEHFYEAELHRMKGELVLAADPDATEEAAAAFLDAVTTAHRQGARSFELRAATALHLVQLGRGPSPDTAAGLGAIVASFGDGLDSSDLVDARVALERSTG